jgi:hypothetical protein
MDELIVTRLWMAGVVAMMLVFGVTAVIGVLRQKRERETKGLD